MKKASQATSSGIDTDVRYATMDEKKRKRMISNRESARRSRLKKQKQMEDMIHEISTLERKIKENIEKCGVMNQSLAAIESENVFMRSLKTRLTNYMNNLETLRKSFMQNFDQNEENAMGDCRRPWQLGVYVGNDGCGSPQPIMSSRLFKT